MEIGDTAKRVLAVVGERFRAFTEMPGVLLVSEARRMISGAGGPVPSSDSSIVLGQGLDWGEASTLGAACHSCGLVMRPDMRCAPRPAGETEVHKTRASNVLITRPHRTGAETFESMLLVHNDNELMLDHYAAMHMPAMVLIEAARQMLLAVTETYYIDSADTAYRFLIHSIQCAFELLVFPLPITVRYEVVRREAKSTQLHFDVVVAIVQGGRSCVTFRITFTAVDLRIARRQEQIAAIAMLNAHAGPARE